MKTVADFPEWSVLESVKKKDLLYVIVVIMMLAIIWFGDFSLLNVWFGIESPIALIIERIIFSILIIISQLMPKLQSINQQHIRYDEDYLYYMKWGKVEAVPWSAVKGIRGELEVDTKRFKIEIGEPHSKPTTITSVGPALEGTTVSLSDMLKINQYIASHGN